MLHTLCIMPKVEYRYRSSPFLELRAKEEQEEGAGKRGEKRQEQEGEQERMQGGRRIILYSSNGACRHNICVTSVKVRLVNSFSSHQHIY